MVFDSRDHIMLRLAVIVFSFAAIGCRQSTPPSGGLPERFSQVSSTADVAEPLDVDCTELTPLRPDRPKAIFTHFDFRNSYFRECSKLDHIQQADEVDHAYGRFAWKIFQWLNPDHSEVRWKNWISREVISASHSHCEPLSDLEQFKPLADCSMSKVSTPASNPLWDINGHLVEIEVRVNPKTKAQLCGRGAENNGPHSREDSAYCRTIKSSSWSQADHGYRNEGPIHIKIAWKTLSEQDCELGRQFILKERTQASRSSVSESAPFGCKAGQAGMIAMNVAIKGRSGGPYWTWLSFSHRDNMDPHHPMFKLCKEGDHCNECSQPGEPTPISRHNAILPWITDLSAMQASPYNNYVLLGVQRQANAWPEGGFRGEIRPRYLANEIIEWDRQSTSCIHCHSWATVLSPPGSDEAAWTCCDTPNQCTSPSFPQRFVRCDPKPDPLLGGTIFVADFFWGLEDWYANFDDYCTSSHERSSP